MKIKNISEHSLYLNLPQVKILKAGQVAEVDESLRSQLSVEKNLELSKAPVQKKAPSTSTKSKPATKAASTKSEDSK